MLFFRLFRKVDPSCAYCRHGTRIGERDVVCLKRGVVPVEHHCRAFRYDPLKRTPPRPALLRLGGLGEEDFLLDAVPGQETLFAGMDAAANGKPDAPETEGETAEKLAETLEMPQERKAAEPLEMPQDWKAAEPLKISEDWEAAEETEPPEALEGTESIEEPEEAEEPETPQEVPEPSEEAAESGEPEKRPMKVKVRAVKIRR